MKDSTSQAAFVGIDTLFDFSQEGIARLQFYFHSLKNKTINGSHPTTQAAHEATAASATSPVQYTWVKVVLLRYWKDDSLSGAVLTSCRFVQTTMDTEK